MKILALSVLIFLSGCAIPVKMTVIPDPVEVARQERIRQEDLMLAKKGILETEKEIILQSFQDSGIILKSFEKLGCSVFDIAGFLNEYGKNDIDGFCDFLAGKHPFNTLPGKYPFNTLQRWALDRDIFEPAKRNHFLLERMTNERLNEHNNPLPQ